MIQASIMINNIFLFLLINKLFNSYIKNDLLSKKEKKKCEN